jgi:ABC-type transport system involved in multi-copper enzyme maturation permease subunit
MIFVIKCIFMSLMKKQLVNNCVSIFVVVVVVVVCSFVLLALDFGVTKINNIMRREKKRLISLNNK